MGLIPPFCFDSVVAIGLYTSVEQFEGIASGFLYGYFLRKVEEKGKEYALYLVTNRHVLEDLERVILRFNPQNIEEPARDFTLELLDTNGNPLWTTHPDSEIDVAVIPINFDELKEQEIKLAYFQNDHSVANIEKLIDLGIMEGDFVYTLGFPMGIVGGLRNVVIARNGCIARIRDTLDRQNKIFLIDTFVFPGNSGGPVISKPEITHIHGTKSQKASYLIGIVKSYLPYREEAISKQTKNTRIIFEENSGLAVVHPVNFIEETIRLCRGDQ